MIIVSSESSDHPLKELPPDQGIESYPTLFDINQPVLNLWSVWPYSVENYLIPFQITVPTLPVL